MPELRQVHPAACLGRAGMPVQRAVTRQVPSLPELGWGLNGWFPGATGLILSGGVRGSPSRGALTRAVAVAKALGRPERAPGRGLCWGLVLSARGHACAGAWRFLERVGCRPEALGSPGRAGEQGCFRVGVREPLVLGAGPGSCAVSSRREALCISVYRKQLVVEKGMQPLAPGPVTPGGEGGSIGGLGR